MRTTRRPGIVNATKYAALGALALAAAGCLTGNARHLLYLEPDGAVTWSVFQESVRWHGDDPTVRAEQERAFLDDVRAERHPVAAALRELGAPWTSTQLVRDRRPYSVVTEARFDSVDDAFGGLLRRLGLLEESELRRDGTSTTWILDCVVDQAGAVPGEDRVEALLAEVENYRFVLTSGRFTQAVGFALTDEETTAILQDPASFDENGCARYELSWTDAPDAIDGLE